MLLLQHPHQLGLRAGAPVVGGEDPGRRPLALRFGDRSLALRPEVAQQHLAVLRRERQRDEQAGLLVIVVVALRPGNRSVGRVLTVPGARGLARIELARLGVGAAVAEGLVEARDAVVHRGQEHQVARAPGVEIAVGEHPDHPELPHLGHVVPAEQLPLVGEQRIDPGVVGTVAHRIVIEEGDRFVEVVQHLGVPAEIGVEHLPGQRQGHPHGVAVVVVRHVVPPVDQVGGSALGCARCQR